MKKILIRTLLILCFPLVLVAGGLGFLTLKWRAYYEA